MDIIETEQRCYKELGRIYGRFDGCQPVLTIGERDLIDRIMFTDFNKFPNRRDMRVGDPVFDNTLFSLEGHDWKRVRNIVKTCFTPSNLKMMTTLLQECCDKMVAKMTLSAQKGEVINCQEHFSIFVLHTIGKCAFGVKITDNDPFVEHSNKLFNNSFKTIIIMVAPYLMKYFKIPILNNETIEFYNNVMSKVVEERKKMKKEKFNDFLQRMLEHEEQPQDSNNNSQDGLSHVEMLSQCVSFFLAGYEATTALLSHCVYRLAMNQECQKKALEEIERVLPQCRPEEMSNCLGKLKYLEAVMKECSRICPPMARIERRAAEDYYFPEAAIHLKEGFLVSIPIFAIHHDPEYYPDPEVFNPDRFFYGERNAFKNIFFPFGSGGRECVGKNFVLMQVKMCLLNLLLNFTILPASTTPEHLEILEVRNVMKVGDVDVILQRRTC
ncbi:cytochrome P450 3A8 [Parasteatoda tepidariorum]